MDCRQLLDVTSGNIFESTQSKFESKVPRRRSSGRQCQILSRYFYDFFKWLNDDNVITVDQQGIQRICSRFDEITTMTPLHIFDQNGDKSRSRPTFQHLLIVSQIFLTRFPSTRACGQPKKTRRNTRRHHAVRTNVTYASAASRRASARSRSTSVIASLRAACMIINENQ